MKAYIIHPTDNLEREAHMRNQINDINFDFTFICDGDQKDLTSEILAKNFKDDLLSVSGISSCTYKHFLAYRDMIANNIDYAIILENDVFLDKKFESIANQALEEVKTRNIENFFLSLEDSFLKFVKGSQRKKGQVVYKNDGENTRCAGAYMIDIECAKNLIKEVDTNRCGVVIDWFHTTCVKNKLINLYWLHPTIASQGSRNGKLRSQFGRKLFDRNEIVRFIWIYSFKLKKLCRLILWRLR